MADNVERPDRSSYGEQSATHSQYYLQLSLDKLRSFVVKLLSIYFATREDAAYATYHVSTHTTMHTLGMIKQLNFRRNIME